MHPIGAVRIDLPQAQKYAIFRRVAIALSHQRADHGTTLIAKAEAFALENGRTLFTANASLEAVSFYEKLGYKLDPNSPGTASSNPIMVKSSPITGFSQFTAASRA